MSRRCNGAGCRPSLLDQPTPDARQGGRPWSSQCTARPKATGTRCGHATCSRLRGCTGPQIKHELQAPQSHRMGPRLAPCGDEDHVRRQVADTSPAHGWDGLAGGASSTLVVAPVAGLVEPRGPQGEPGPVGLSDARSQICCKSPLSARPHAALMAPSRNPWSHGGACCDGLSQFRPRGQTHRAAINATSSACSIRRPQI